MKASPAIVESSPRRESYQGNPCLEPIVMRREMNPNQQDAMEALRGLLHRQHRYYTPSERYLVHCPQGESSSLVTENWRRKICEWIFEIVDHFNFDRDLVTIALRFLDRSISKSSTAPVDKREYQLAAVTSLYLAVKLHGNARSSSGNRLHLGLPTLIELCRGIFTEDIIQESERKLASLLDWHLNPPTPLQYIVYFLRLCPQWSASAPLEEPSHRTFATAAYDTAKYLTEIASFSLDLAFESDAGSIAYACLLGTVSIVQTTVQIPADAHRTWMSRLREVDSSFHPYNETIVMTHSRIRELSPELFDRVQEPQVVSDEIAPRTKRTRESLSPSCVIDGVSGDDLAFKRYRNMNDMEDALSESSDPS